MYKLNTQETQIVNKAEAIIFSLATGALVTIGLGLFAGVTLYFAARKWYQVYKAS